LDAHKDTIVLAVEAEGQIEATALGRFHRMWQARRATNELEDE
jgi:hypothetical protein